MKFFSEFRSPDGKMHWAVNVYNTSSSVVTCIKDLKFEFENALSGKKTTSVEELPLGRFYVEAVSKSKFVVVDRMHDKEIASFCELPDANHFCDIKNANELYAEAIA